MTCARPDCTGVHSHTKPYDEWCPATKDAHARAQGRYKSTAKGILTDVRYDATRRGNR